jgi:hypothetical protein
MTALSNDQEINIYPIPFQSNIVISTGLSNISVAILDVLGKVVYEADSSEGSMSPDLSHLTPGIYYVVVKDGGKTFNQKIIKQ